MAEPVADVANIANIAKMCHALGLRPVASHAFGTWPSPVRRLAALGAKLGSPVSLKDDGGAAEFGGNKPRKLELLLAEATARKADRILTIGSVGSNQILATAVFARRLGLGVTALVSPRSGASDERVVAATLRAAALGVTFVPAEAHEVAARLDEMTEDAAHETYVVPSGGSTPLGNLAFVAAAFELAEQVASGAVPMPEEIFVPLGTGGTAAGLAVGCALAKLPCRIVAVRVAPRETVDDEAPRRHVTALAARLRSAGLQGFDAASVASSVASIEMVADALGDGYGVPTEAGDRATAIARELEDVGLEPTYTAKTMAALIAACARRPGVERLFWQTANTNPIDGEAADAASLPPRLRGWLGIA